jgi:hypothetical protein
MPKQSKGTKAMRAFHVIAGVKKHFPRQGALMVGGTPYTPEQLVRFFQAHIDAIDAVDAAHADVLAAITRERDVARQVRKLTHLLKYVVAVMLGEDPSTWADFGWEPPKKPGPKTLEAKVRGAERARATRKERGTMGKRQRKKTRG